MAASISHRRSILFLLIGLLAAVYVVQTFRLLKSAPQLPYFIEASSSLSWPPNLPNATASVATNNEIVDFERQEGVVVAVKIHGPHVLPMLKQSLCLFTAAYNGRYKLHYDHVVFTTIPLSADQVTELKDIVAPAKLEVVVDSKPLQEVLASLSPERRDALIDRCLANDASEFTWQTKCSEPGFHLGNISLAYNWQAEFRAKHIWTHPALANYRVMLWLDSDAMCTQVWEQDPVTTMLRNNLIVLFDNFPNGLFRDNTIPDRIKQAFNQTVCGIELKDGHLSTMHPPGPCHNIQSIHGFFHVTNLDVYRSEPALKWYDILLGDTKYSRQFDDQISVTGVALLDPSRAWDMRSHGLKFRIMHNGWWDGRRRYVATGEALVNENGKPYKKAWYRGWWRVNAARDFPEAWNVCQPLVRTDG